MIEQMVLVYVRNLARHCWKQPFKQVVFADVDMRLLITWSVACDDELLDMAFTLTGNETR